MACGELCLQGRIVPALLNESLVIFKRGSEQTAAKSLELRLVGQSLVAGLGEEINNVAGLTEVLHGEGALLRFRHVRSFCACFLRGQFLVSAPSLELLSRYQGRAGRETNRSEQQ